MSILPGRLAAGLDRLRPSFKTSYGGPFNGQLARQEMVKELFRTFALEVVVETGTFRGTSTEFFRNLTDAPIYTVEALPRFFYYSRRRFKEDQRTHIYLDDSRRFLRTLAVDPAVPKKQAFFYLDAHVHDDLPVREEVATIAENWTEYVVVIDDFQVPGDPGYGFGDYGPGNQLTADHLPSAGGFLVLYPKTPASEETGRRRGCCVLVAEDLIHLVPQLTVLLRVEGGT